MIGFKIYRDALLIVNLGLLLNGKQENRGIQVCESKDCRHLKISSTNLAKFGVLDTSWLWKAERFVVLKVIHLRYCSQDPRYIIIFVF